MKQMRLSISTPQLPPDRANHLSWHTMQTRPPHTPNSGCRIMRDPGSRLRHPEDAGAPNGQWNDRHTQEIARGEAQFRKDSPPQSDRHPRSADYEKTFG
ncbi:MAG: hypothetical protein U9N46_05510 [Euryarchaeota archaeon]|nr:hypothetical protein [Euryarchaeota archaeon]